MSDFAPTWFAVEAELYGGTAATMFYHVRKAAEARGKALLKKHVKQVTAVRLATPPEVRTILAK